MKIIIVGTSEFGIPTFESIRKAFEIPLVITQPDRPTGRKQELTSPPVKLWAEKNKLAIAQPEKIQEAKQLIANSEADLILVTAYGQIIPKEILETTKFGSINIHPSILPKYRGATPIQNAILNGDPETGITIIQMDEQMDHGPILGIKKVSISDGENFSSLQTRLSLESVALTLQVVKEIFDHKSKPQTQDHSRATSTTLLSKKDGRINWTEPAHSIYHKILALNPEPGSWTMLEEKNVKILRAELNHDNKIELPGKIYRSGNDLMVKCSDFSLKILEIQPEGKKPMPGSDFLNGLKNLDTKLFV